jgi:hypothetical protein
MICINEWVYNLNSESYLSESIEHFFFIITKHPTRCYFCTVTHSFSYDNII